MDIRELPPSSTLPRVEITKYSWTDGAASEPLTPTRGPPRPEDDHFVITLNLNVGEAVKRSGVKVKFSERALDLWVVCEDAAHHLWIPKLYKTVQAARCVARPGGGHGQVVLLLRKLDTQPWRFLKS